MRTAEEFATYLLVGFVKHWRIHDVMSACGTGCFNLEMEELNSIAGFMPSQAFSVHTPVRAYIANQWPKLSEYMLKHEHEPQKLAALVPQILRLKYDQTRRGTTISDKDRSEINTARRLLRQTTTSYRESRKAFKSNQRSAWNVVKA